MAKRGIVLMNLGSPDSTDVKDVRRYLNEFLMDERVIDKSYLPRLLLVKGIITPFRAKKSAHAYQTIWTKEGSPLIVITRQLQKLLEARMQEPVVIAMRYGNPSPKHAFDTLQQQHPDLEEVVLVPLYPHYAMSSYETAAEYARLHYKQGNYSFKLSITDVFYNHPAYIEALAESIKPYLQNDYDQILFSYHGIPERHIVRGSKAHQQYVHNPDCCAAIDTYKSTCYKYQISETTRLVKAYLGIPEEKLDISFQSRLGKGWLTPFTDKRLEQLPQEGKKKLLVVCPAFVSDCLETLEEIEIQGKETFLQAGGEQYTMIPCLNTQEPWLEALQVLINNTHA